MAQWQMARKEGARMNEFAAITPRAFPCVGNRVGTIPCHAFAVVRIGVENLCEEHARSALNLEHQLALVRLAKVGRAVVACLLLFLAVGKGPNVDPGPKGGPQAEGPSASQEVCPQTLPECRQ